MAPFEEAQVCIHAADHGFQELIPLAALQLSHLASTLKACILCTSLRQYIFVVFYKVLEKFENKYTVKILQKHSDHPIWVS